MSVVASVRSLSQRFVHLKLNTFFLFLTSPHSTHVPVHRVQVLVVPLSGGHWSQVVPPTLFPLLPPPTFLLRCPVTTYLLTPLPLCSFLMDWIGGDGEVKELPKIKSQLTLLCLSHMFFYDWCLPLYWPKYISISFLNHLGVEMSQHCFGVNLYWLQRRLKYNHALCGTSECRLFQ